ncbi:MAG: putative ABC transporter permease [Lachnospiraceae bacterium]|nr:putative ABC transporter permease [Lachnospiraceae bacterium]
MIVSQYAIAFMFFSFLGWVYECIYCTFKSKHWENRGFLFGPVCPIYGFSIVVAMFLFGHVPLLKQGYASPVWLVFIICALGSAVVEYSTSYILERIFHAVWWDYSEVPLNINGRICVPATCGFGIAGVFIVRYILPAVNSIPMDDHQLFNEFLSLVLMLILGIDIAVTVASLSDMLSRMEAMQEEFDRKMQSGYELASQAPGAVVSAAKHNALNAKQELTRAVSGYVKNIPSKDRHHMRNIRGFRSDKNKSIAERAATYLREHDPRKNKN